MANYIDTRLSYLLTQRAAELAAAGRVIKRGRQKTLSMGTPSMDLLALPAPDWYHDYRCPTYEEEYTFARRLRSGMRVITNRNSPSPYRMATVRRVDSHWVWAEVRFDDRPPSQLTQWHVSYFDPVPSI